MAAESLPPSEPPDAPPPAAPPRDPREGRGPLALTPGERRLLALLVGGALGLTGVGYWREHRIFPPELVRQTALEPVDLNTASAEELELLRGIGPTLAARIVAYREARGPFKSVWELTRVEGLDRRLVEALAPQLTTGPARTADRGTGKRPGRPEATP